MHRVLKIVVVAGGILAAFLGGTRYGARETGSAASGRRVLRYICPMHPQYASERPGDAPCCGMKLEPVYADGSGAAAAPPGAIEVSAARQQTIGVRVAPAEKWSGVGRIRTTGRVAPDETRLYSLNASTECWVRRIYPPTTGSIVRKDEPLLAFYTTNLLTTASSFLYALETVDRHKASGMDNGPQVAMTAVQVRQAMENLQNLGVSGVQIEEMRRTRKVSELVEVRSPVAGILLSKKVRLGQWLGPGTEMCEVADLSRVWILADVFENEARHIRPGVKARASYGGKAIDAEVAHVLPQFDGASRTLKVRMEVDNPGYALRPEMFVDVEFPVTLPPSVTAPADAVLDSGMRKTVFVDRGNGYFEPRAVETGWRFGDRVEIVKGLEAGERIAVSGNFLLDSETRMKAAATMAAVKDPVCGMDVDPAKAAGKSDYKGNTYYFCSRGCKESFDKDPESYLKRPAGGHMAAVTGSGQ